MNDRIFFLLSNLLYSSGVGFETCKRGGSVGGGGRQVVGSCGGANGLSTLSAEGPLRPSCAWSSSHTEADRGAEVAFGWLWVVLASDKLVVGGGLLVVIGGVIVS